MLVSGGGLEGAGEEGSVEPGGEEARVDGAGENADDLLNISSSVLCFAFIVL